MLNRRSRAAIIRWIDRIESRDVGGLYLVRDRAGWCRVRLVTGGEA